MATTTWTNTAGGDFNDSADWSAGVPAAGDTALITAKGSYTVAVTQNNSVGTLETAKGATLAVIGPSETFGVTSGTGAGKGALAGTVDVEDAATFGLGADGTDATFNNAGAINVLTSSDGRAVITIAGDVTLTGKGHISLFGGIVSDGNAATLTNNGNTIAGAGGIGDVIDPLLSVTNGAKGVIDANNGTTPLEIELDDGEVTNNGLMEATGTAGLVLVAATVTQAPKGEIKAASTGFNPNSGTADGAVVVVNVTINGGVISIAKGGTLLAEDSTIENTSPIANAGTIFTEGGIGPITISSAIKDAKTGVLAAEDNAVTSVSGAVTKGSAEIFDRSSIEFGAPSSANVVFEAGSTGMLVLDDAPGFKGTVSAFAGTGVRDTSSLIELSNINSTNVNTPTFSGTTKGGTLTVTDGANTDSIKLVGNYTTETWFTAAGTDGTLIYDSSAPGAAPKHAHLLVQSMASFGANGGATSVGGGGADHHRSSDFLASPHHG